MFRVLTVNISPASVEKATHLHWIQTTCVKGWISADKTKLQLGTPLEKIAFALISGQSFRGDLFIPVPTDHAGYTHIHTNTQSVCSLPFSQVSRVEMVNWRGRFRPKGSNSPGKLRPHTYTHVLRGKQQWGEGTHTHTHMHTCSQGAWLSLKGWSVLACLNRQDSLCVGVSATHTGPSCSGMRVSRFIIRRWQCVLRVERWEGGETQVQTGL